MVRNDKPGSDCHQLLAQAVQPDPATSGAEHATTRTGNLNRESLDQWPGNRGLDKGNLLRHQQTSFRRLVQ